MEAQAPVEIRPLTLDELLAMGDARIEVIGGKVVAMSAVGILHQLLMSNVVHLLQDQVRSTATGYVFHGGLGYLMHADPDHLQTMFVPDVSFIRADQLITDFNPEQPYPGVPTLAVEIVSPGDSAERLQRKIRTYLEKGTEQVIIIFPATREVHQYRRDHSPAIRIYTGSEHLDLEALFPGLELTTDAIFDLPAWVRDQA